jgi:hypothetical protein
MNAAFVVVSGIAANSSIRANDEYVASTGFGLGEYEASYQGIEGFVIANTFQLNLEYHLVLIVMLLMYLIIMVKVPFITGRILNIM